MYLHSAIVDKEGASYPMVGAISAACVNRGKLVRFGYIELSEKESWFLPKGEMIRGHEFHYFDSEKNGEDCVARKPVTGREYECVMVGESYWIGFPHLYYPSNLEFPKRFVEKAAGRLLLL
jgi:cobyrinic acid a,c-diamide synthase